MRLRTQPRHPGRLLIAILLAVLSSGCAMTPPAPTTLRPAQTAQPLTEDQAVDLVRQQPDIAEYRKAVEAAGRKLAWRVQESPSWYVIQLGESSPEKFTTTRWYVVNKKTGTVQKWNITQGSPPSD